MNIRIDDDKTTVVFKASEKAALPTTLRICNKLAEHLQDENAAKAAEFLEHVIGSYLPEAQEPTEA